MRELAITQNLLQAALKKANSRRIVNVNLWIGPFSDEREQTIRFYWRDLAKGTLGEGARLRFRHIATDMSCVACGGALDLDSSESICVYCQHARLLLAGEDEVSLESIEME